MTEAISSTTTRHGADEVRYLRPGRFTRSVFNPLIAGLTKLGLSVRGSRVLAVRGRVSGEWRTTPVNVLTLAGERYLVAPRGETDWVRNIRAARLGELRVGRRREAVRVVELTDEQKLPVLRAYLTAWRWEVGAFFDGVSPDADDEAMGAIAPGYPAFLLVDPDSAGSGAAA